MSKTHGRQLQILFGPSVNSIIATKFIIIKYLITLWTFSLIPSSVAAISPLPGPRAYHCSAILNNSMFIFGGIGNGNGSNSGFSSIALPIIGQQKWQALPVSNSLMVSDSACVTTSDNKLLVIGGSLISNDSSKNPATNSFLQLYDPSSQKWFPQTVSGTNAFLYRRGHAAANVILQDTKSGIFVFGGESPLAPDPNPTYLLAPASNNTWKVTQIPTQANGPQESLLYAGITVVKQKVFIIGGTYLNGTANTNIYSFDVVRNEWTQESPQHPLSPACPSCTIAIGNFNNKLLYVIPPGSKQQTNPAQIQTLTLGGQNGSPTISNVTQVPIDLASSKNLTIPSRGFSAVTYNNQVVLLYGGLDSAGILLDELCQFNMSNVSWSLLGHTTNNSTTLPNTPLNTPSSDSATKLSKLPLVLGSIIGILGLIALVSLIIYQGRIKRRKKFLYLNSDSRANSIGPGSPVVADERTLESIGAITGNKKQINTSDKLFISRLVRRLSLLSRGANSISGEEEQRLRTMSEGSESRAGGDTSSAKSIGDANSIVNDPSIDISESQLEMTTVTPQTAAATVVTVSVSSQEQLSSPQVGMSSQENNDTRIANAYGQGNYI